MRVCFKVRDFPCYSRDLEGADYWLTMKKKPVKKKKSKKNHKKSKKS